MRPLSQDDPSSIGRYRVLALLGQGGMGRVYFAIGPDGRQVAIKRILPQFAHDPGFRKRFALEVAATRGVTGPHTVQVVDADTDAAEPWSASAFVPGPTLLEAVEANGPLAEPHVRRLGLDLCTALTAIHAARLIHRDVKASNVLLSARGAQLFDFGISRAMDRSTSMALTQTGGLLGSPGYMSPEQAETRALTERSDVFSLGCLLAMAATGKTPFDGPSIPQVLYKVVHEGPELAGLPVSLREPIERCLAKRPEERPAPAELRALLARGGPAADQPPPVVLARVAEQDAEIRGLLSAAPPPDPTPERRRGLLPGALIAAAVVLVLMIVAALAAPGLWKREDTAGASDSATEVAESSEVAAPPAAEDVSLAVPSVGAVATGLDEDWVDDLAYWQDWEPYLEADVRSMVTAGEEVGFIGIGLLDRDLVAYTSGGAEYAVTTVATLWTDGGVARDEELKSSAVTTTAVEIDGRPALLGEFRLEWEEPIANGDTGADYAVILAELDDGVVFAGFLGLFDSQSEYYAPALEVLLTVAFYDAE